MTKTFVEIGAGKGLGNAVAKRFAENGYKVVLLARSMAHLEEYKDIFYNPTALFLLAAWKE